MDTYTLEVEFPLLGMQPITSPDLLPPPAWNIEEDDSQMSEEEFFAMIDRGKAQIEAGNSIRLKTREELLAFLEQL